MVDQSEGASPTAEDLEDEIRNKCMSTASIPTRQADWEAGREAAARRAEELRFDTGPTIAEQIRALSYPGPSGAQDAPISEICGKTYYSANRIVCTALKGHEEGKHNWMPAETVAEGAQDAPQPHPADDLAHERIRLAALESLLPGRAANAAQTDWGKGYIEGWVAKSQAKEGM